MRLAYLYMLLINLLDYFTTAELVHLEGFEIESNSLLRRLMYLTDTPYIILLAKFIPIIIFGIGMWVMKKVHPERYGNPLWKLTAWAINIALTCIVIRSIYTLL